MKTAKFANEHLNASIITCGFVQDEIQEVIEAIKNKDLTELKEELSDVLYFSYCWLYGKTGINLPMIGAMPTINKIQTRLRIWQDIFVDHELVFDKKYLVGGSNYKKQSKIDAALKLARTDQVL